MNSSCIVPPVDLWYIPNISTGILSRGLAITRTANHFTKAQSLTSQQMRQGYWLNVWKRMLNLGAKSSPPKVARVPHITMLEENNVKRGFFKHQDFLKFREALPYHLRNFVTFAYKTGWRFSEISNLSWKQIDRKNNVVRLDAGTTKNKDGRVIYLDSELQEVLQCQFVNQQVGCKYVFHREGNQISDFRQSWNTTFVKSVWDMVTNLIVSMFRNGRTSFSQGR